jgi:hypothetical protein
MAGAVGLTDDPTVHGQAGSAVPAADIEPRTRLTTRRLSRRGQQKLRVVLGIGASRSNTSLVDGRVILRVLAPMVPDKQAQEHSCPTPTEM